MSGPNRTGQMQVLDPTSWDLLLFAEVSIHSFSPLANTVASNVHPYDLISLHSMNPAITSI